MLAVNLCRSCLYSLNYETTCILFILCFYHNYTSFKACWRMYSGFGEIPYLSILVTWTLEDIGMSRWEVEGLLEVVHLHSRTVLSHSAGNWKPRMLWFASWLGKQNISWCDFHLETSKTATYCSLQVVSVTGFLVAAGLRSLFHTLTHHLGLPYFPRFVYILSHAASVFKSAMESWVFIFCFCQNLLLLKNVR